MLISKLEKNSSKKDTLIKSARSFFMKLCWDYENNNGYLRVFFEHETANQPLKWLKYLLLEKVGLTTKAELDTSIKRYEITDYQKARQGCENLIRQSSNDSMIVVKIVFLDQAGQLPNFRVYALADVEKVFNQISKLYSKENASQIWLCYSGINSQGSDLGGRITRTREGLEPSIIEIVWYASPRLIETYNSPNFKYPFIRARKQIGSMQFYIEEMRAPSEYGHKKQKYLEDFQWVLTELYKHKEAVELLEQILYGAGANELSIEFKISNGVFSVIDWDTEIETAVSQK